MNVLKSFSKADSEKKKRPTILEHTISEPTSNSPSETSPSEPQKKGLSHSTSTMSFKDSKGLGMSSTIRRASVRRPGIPNFSVSVPQPAEQEIVQEPMPSQEEVAKVLESVLDALGFEEAQKQNIRKMNVEKQWQMIQSLKHKSEMEKSTGEKTTPEHFILKINQKNYTPKLLQSLRVQLRSQPMSWVLDFNSKGGLAAMLSVILDIVHKTSRKSTDYDSLHEIIRCLKGFMNNKHGIKAVLEDDNSLNTIILAYDCVVPYAERGLVLELLIVMCYVEGQRGLQKVIQAFDKFKEFKKEEFRFDTVVKSLIKACQDVNERDPQKDVLDYLVTTIILINSLIFQQEDYELRVSVRNEMFLVDFGIIFEKLKKIDAELLKKQIEKFESEMKLDFEELVEEYDQIKTEKADPKEIFTDMFKINAKSSSQKPFLSVFQHLALIRGDDPKKRFIWDFIYRCVNQIIFDGQGIDPDFRPGKFKLNVDKIIDSFTENNSKNKSFDERMKEALEEAKGAKAKLESAQKEKEKIDNEWADKYDKVKSELEGQIAASAGLLSADTIALKKALKVLKEKKADGIEEALKIIQDSNVELDESKVSTTAPSAPIGAGAPPPPPPPGMEFGGPPPPPPPGMGFGGPPPPPPPPGGFPGAPPPPPPPGGFPGFPGAPPPPPPPGGFPGAPPPPPGFGPPPPPGFGPPPPGFGMPPPPKRFISSTKMKNFFWDKLTSNNIKGTVWEKTKIDEEFYKKELNWFEFEETFAVKASNADAGAKKPEKKKVELISVIDSKKAYNCSLMLGLLKMTNEEIKKAILTVDKDNQLADNTITQLINFVPSAEEVAALQPFKEDPSKLAAADQFLLAVSSIPRLDGRLNGISYKRSFNEKLNELKPKVDAVATASRELKTNQNFHKVLEIVLFMGNYMNGTGRAGGAAGFKISSMNKLSDTKSINNKTHLLHYIVSIIEAKFPNVIGFTKDFAIMEDASKVSLNTLNAEVNELRSGLKKIENELEIFEKEKNRNPIDEFGNVFKVFVAEARQAFEDFEKKYKRMEESFQQVLVLFAEDSKMQPDEFYSNVLKFVQLFEQSLKENKERLEQQAKEEKKRLEQEEKEKKKNESKRNVKTIGIDQAGDDDKAILDDMLQSLKNGEAYVGEERRKKKNKKKGDDDDDDAAAAMLRQLQQQ